MLVRLLGQRAGQKVDLGAGSKRSVASTAPEVTVNSLSWSGASEFSSTFLFIFLVTPHNRPSTDSCLQEEIGSERSSDVLEITQ